MSEEAALEPKFGEMPKEIYATYSDERQRLTQGEQDYGKTFDRYVTTLSAGAIALSLAFLNDFVGETPITGAWRLILAWTALGLAMGMSVFGIYLSPISFAEHRSVLDEEAAQGGQQYWARVRQGQRQKRKPRISRWLNWLSMLAFLVGLAMLMWFALESVSSKGLESE